MGDAEDYTRSRLSGVTPPKKPLITGPGIRPGGAPAVSGGRVEGGALPKKDETPSSPVVSSRVLYTESNQPHTRLTTYQSGDVVFTDILTGRKESYKTGTGQAIQAGEVSIPSKGIKSFEEQKPQFDIGYTIYRKGTKQDAIKARVDDINKMLVGPVRPEVRQELTQEKNRLLAQQIDVPLSIESRFYEATRTDRSFKRPVDLTLKERMQYARVPKEIIVKAQEKGAELAKRGTLEGKTSKYLKEKKIFDTEWIIERQKQSKKDIEEYKRLEQKGGVKGLAAKYFRVTEEKIAPVQFGTEYGFRKELQDKPIQTGIKTAAFFVLPGALQGIGGIARLAGGTRLASVSPYTTKIVGGTLKYGLPLAYGASTTYRIASKPRYSFERGQAIGKITAGELLPMYAGGRAASYVWPRVSGFIRTIGRKEIPTEKIVMESALTGKDRYPQAPTSKHFEMFKEGRYNLPVAQRYTGTRYQKGEWQAIEYKDIPAFRPQPYTYHATASKINNIVEAGSSELPGLYVAPGVSPAFLRIGGANTYSLYGGSTFNPYGSPKVAAIRPIGIRKGTPVGGEKGYAYVPGIKTEVEAIYPVDTKLLPGTKEYYFKYSGVRVPINKFGVAGKGVSGKTGLSEISASYRIPKSSPITTPSSYALSISSITPQPSYARYQPVSLSRISSASRYTPSSYTSYSGKISSSYSKSTSLKPSSTYSSASKPSSYAGSYKPSSSPISQLSRSSIVSSSVYELPSYSPTSYRSSISAPRYSYSTIYSPPYTPPPYTPPPYTPPPYTPPPYTPPPLTRWRTEDVKTFAPAFRVEVKRGGKFTPYSAPLPFGRASKLGTEITSRTLAATFRLRPSGQTKLKDIPFKISPKVFRSYKIEKGTKKFMPLTFIQKTSQEGGLGSGRLSSKMEVAEIRDTWKRKLRKL